MNISQAKIIINLLKGRGVCFESGLTEEEVSQVESKFNFKFPPDLRLLLQTALPVSDFFVNWRNGIKSDVEKAKLFSEGKLLWVLENQIEKNIS